MKRLRLALSVYRQELYFARLEQYRPTRIATLASTIIRLQSKPIVVDGSAKAEVDAYVTSMDAARIARRRLASGGSR